MKRLREMLRFRAVPRAAYGLSASTYLSVLSAHAAWPTLAQLVHPKGEGGAVPGYGMPRSQDASKEQLAQPMERGAYWITSPDRATVMTLRLLSKEEAGFDPEALLNTEFARRFTQEAWRTIRATWAIGQLTFDSHHPQVLPALDFAVTVAARLASLTEGLVADPMRFSYQLPGEYEVDGEFHVENHVAVYAESTGDGGKFFTRGMEKFGLPDWELAQIPPEQSAAAEALLYSIAFTVLTRAPIQPGETVGASRAPFLVALSTSAIRPTGKPPAYELIAAGRDTISECLAAWAKEQL